MARASTTPRDTFVTAPLAFDAALWSRLEAMQLDAPEASLTFTRRLARENGWSLARARDVIAEYRRFLYLAARAGHPVTPSDAVDQAWHLHLVYTRHYWGVLCRQVLGFELHHGPTLGGEREQAKFGDWYQRTLESYRAAFGEPPPGIWPGVADRFDARQRMQRVDLGASWAIPKPSLRGAALLGYALTGLVALMLAASLLRDGGSAAIQAAVVADGQWAILPFVVIVVALGLLVFLAWDTGSFLGSVGVVALLGAASFAVPRGAALWTAEGAARCGLALVLTLAAFGLLIALYRTRKRRLIRRKSKRSGNSGVGAGCGGYNGGGCGGSGCGGCGG